MALYIRNSTPNTVYVALGYPDPNCSPNGYAKVGWYAVAPGRTSLVRSGQTINSVFYFYAEDTVGHVWGGSVIFTDIPNQRFDRCWIEACTPCRRLGFALLLTGNTVNYTLNLVLSGSQRKSKSGNIHIVWPTIRKLKFRKYPHGIIKKTKSQRKLKSANIRMILPRKPKERKSTIIQHF